MKAENILTLSTSPPSCPAGKPRLTPRFLYGRTRRHFTGKGQDAETGLYYYGARYLDPKTSRWAGGDPALGGYVPQAGRGLGGLPGMGGVYNTVNLHAYHYAGNNPVKYVDPDGMTTEIDEATGEVKNVTFDFSNDVIAYPYSSDGARLEGPGNYIGETWFWDEFIDPETGKAFGGIQIGASFDPLIEYLHNIAEGMNLIDIAKGSNNGRIFDIKARFPNGRLLNGKYASSRSAGNFLAGYNAGSGIIGSKKYVNAQITFDGFQMLAGALHIRKSQGKPFTDGDKANVLLRGTARGLGPTFVPPTYGELNYQYRMSRMGWEYGGRK